MRASARNLLLCLCGTAQWIFGGGHCFFACSCCVPCRCWLYCTVTRWKTDTGGDWRWHRHCHLPGKCDFLSAAQQELRSWGARKVMVVTDPTRQLQCYARTWHCCFKKKRTWHCPFSVLGWALLPRSKKRNTSNYRAKSNNFQFDYFFYKNIQIFYHTASIPKKM